MSGSRTTKPGSAQGGLPKGAAGGGDRRIANPRRSSNGLREDVLRVLGVMKVATADQIQRAAAPHLTYRHTTKPTAARRKEARTAAHRGALADLRASGHVLFGGHTRDAQGLRLLTPLGLDSARSELGRPKEEMGGTARGAGRSGAQHAMAVNETILARCCAPSRTCPCWPVNHRRRWRPRRPPSTRRGAWARLARTSPRCRCRPPVPGPRRAGAASRPTSW
ncbi:hypothetical protein AB0M29_38860 [Streptomyces sp. NPDC051976]|uniref:hypothetical protein n=1 Tax=Streptomyces sp. NPDC051976 TaxID=3154947 RepID=UPI0034469021